MLAEVGAAAPPTSRRVGPGRAGLGPGAPRRDLPLRGRGRAGATRVWQVDRYLQEVIWASGGAYTSCHVKRTDVQVADGATPARKAEAARKAQV